MQSANMTLTRMTADPGSESAGASRRQTRYRQFRVGTGFRAIGLAGAPLVDQRKPIARNAAVAIDAGICPACGEEATRPATNE
jgi:hypothetical protein